MTTILLEKNKRENKRQYVLGFFRQLLNVLTVVAVIVLVFEVTVYYSVKFEKSVLEKNFSKSEQASKEKVLTDYKNTLQKTKDFAKSFSTEDKLKKKALDFVLGLQNDQVAINMISLEEKDGKSFIRIEGVADNRETLASLGSYLDSSPVTEDVVLPVSSFTKTFDIPFVVNFVYKYE